ncbi:holo-ACP synthase [Chryseobacterium nepalense]|uniref:Holo-[acyl-carrier-protein] synthase n=1 Tax=Chryseobacterium nepalense TaxID=1854498 RepID=A0ABY4K6R9_9FLAO|nr:holo-ACP synthase [Chryseobacterium nepalense]UPQ75262.1 holo-ACP synthase [Chryseobacterium nepalense]
MIIGIGCDIVEHQICRNLNWENDIKILKRIFSNAEIDIYNLKKDLRFLAGRFAAKEAILKCLGTGMHDGISLLDIEILQSIHSKPIVRLSGEPKKIADQLKVNNWHISISHSSKFSISYVVVESI